MAIVLERKQERIFGPHLILYYRHPVSKKTVILFGERHDTLKVFNSTRTTKSVVDFIKEHTPITVLLESHPYTDIFPIMTYKYYSSLNVVEEFSHTKPPNIDFQFCDYRLMDGSDQHPYRRLLISKKYLLIRQVLFVDRDRGIRWFLLHQTKFLELMNEFFDEAIACLKPGYMTDNQQSVFEMVKNTKRDLYIDCKEFYQRTERFYANCLARIERVKALYAVCEDFNSLYAALKEIWAVPFYNIMLDSWMLDIPILYKIDKSPPNTTLLTLTGSNHCTYITEVLRIWGYKELARFGTDDEHDIHILHYTDISQY